MLSVSFQGRVLRGTALFAVGTQLLVGCNTSVEGPAEPLGVSAAALLCDDGNSCTYDWYSTIAPMGCRHNNLASGTACTGTKGSCTGNGTCDGAGTCTVTQWCNDSNACTNDTCFYSMGTGSWFCMNLAVTNGTVCNDGNLCTQTDTCQSGTCTGASPKTCTALDQCHNVGTCDPATGQCSNPSKSDGTTCSDGNGCTQTDTCQNGACTGANPKTCTASDQCHDVGTCSPSTGVCSNPAKTNGTGCNDGNACTQTDTCQSGACTGSNPKTCTASDQCHLAGTCDPGSGNCSNPNKADGSGCTDGNACTQTDTCQSGTCTGSNPKTCTALDQCHVAGTCDPGTGNCSNPNKTDGSGCNDGNACTQTDTCQSGTCTGSNPKTCTALDQCHVAGTCNPGTGSCSNPNKADGSGCNDGNGCTQTDTCQSGTCSGSNPKTCTALDQCHLAGTCDPGSGNCSNPNKTDGSGCNDGNACTQSDTCQNGTCAGTNPVVCTALDQCHDVGTCNTSTGVCSNPAKANGSFCTDGNACTLSDTCQSGTCQPGNPKVCDDTQCQVCNATSGTCEAKANGTTCDKDSSLCTQNDSCQAGVCTVGPAVICTGSDQCKTCNPSTGTCAVNKPNGTACSDGNACTQTDTCQTGTCQGSNPVVCTASDQCHDVGTCNTTNGTCSNPPKPNGSWCTDSNPCWVGESCQSGVCAGGSTYTCPAPDQCHEPATCSASPTDGNPVCTFPNKQNGTGCNDNNACTQTDTCQGGACTGANPVVCTASDQCHDVGACNPANGTCTDPTRPNGSWCTDGNECTQSDSCQRGVCVGNDPVICGSDGNPCTSDACNPQQGTCDYAPEPSSHGCDDSNVCTGSDHCDGAGHCVGGPGNAGLGCDDQNACTGPDSCTLQGMCAGPDVNKDDANPCTEDLCESLWGVWHRPLASGTPCSDGNPLNGDELCDSNGTCKPGVMGTTVLPYEETVIERRLGTGRHPVAVSPVRMAVTFVEMMKDAEAAPRIGVATFDHFGALKGAGRFDTTVIDSAPVIAELPDGGFALAYTSMGEQGGDGLDIVLRTSSADGVISSTKVIANESKTLGQRAADIVWAGDHLVVGWEDESIAGIRQVCWRSFSDKLVAMTNSECDGDKATASLLTLGVSGTQVAKAWRKEGTSGPSVEVVLPGGRHSFPLAEASPSGTPALTALGADWMVAYTEGCGVQQVAILNDTGEVLSQTPLGTGTPERYEPSLAVTESGIYLSWREPAQFEGGVWGANLDEVYLQQHTWANNLLTPGLKHTLPAGSALLQGDQGNAAIAPVPLADGGALWAAWEDLNPNAPGHSNHGDVLVSLIVTPVVRP